MKRSKIAVFSASAIGATILVAACGNGSDEAPPESETTELVVGSLPIADAAPFYYAMNEGWFEDAGLDIEPNFAAEGPTLLSSIVSGEMHFGNTNVVSVLHGAQSGLPLQMVRENNRESSHGIYARSDSGIESPEDFEGTTVAINSLGNIMEVTTLALLDDYGVDISTVDFAEMPISEMSPTLEAEQVDAIWLFEPFVTFAERDGHVRVLDVFEGPTEGLPVSGWVANESFVSENPEVVEAFVSVMDEAMLTIQENPELFVETVPSFTDIEPELAAELTPPGFVVESDFDGLDRLHDLMVEYDLLDEDADIDLEGLVYTTDS